MKWPRAAGLVGGMVWSGDSRMHLSSTARCSYHQNRRPCLDKKASHHDAERGHGLGPMERHRSNGGEVADTWADACSGSVCGLGPSTVRTDAEDRMESGIFVGFQLKSSEYIANGESITARTSQRKLAFERWPTLRRSSAYRSGYGTDLDTGKKRLLAQLQSNARRQTSTRSLSGLSRKNGRSALRKSEGPTTSGRG